MGRGRDAAFMARIRNMRGEYSDIRDGRLLRQVRIAFIHSKGEPVSTPELRSFCYPWQSISGELRGWHRANVHRAARRVARPIGRLPGRGRPFLWAAIEGKIDERNWEGRLKRRREREAAARPSTTISGG